MEKTPALTIEFLRWVARQPRAYPEAIETWRSSCPRLTIWEDALNDGLIHVVRGANRTVGRVTLTPHGKALLDANG